MWAAFLFRTLSLEQDFHAADVLFLWDANLKHIPEKDASLRLGSESCRFCLFIICTAHALYVCAIYIVAITIQKSDICTQQNNEPSQGGQEDDKAGDEKQDAGG